MMPAFAESSLLAISTLHRAPLSMSAEDSQGLIALMICGSQARRASAAAPLFVPDQLMNTSIVAPIMARTRSSLTRPGALAVNAGRAPATVEQFLKLWKGIEVSVSRGASYSGNCPATI